MVRRALHPGVFLEVGIHVTRFGMFRSRAGIAAQLLFTASSYWTACRRRPFLHTQGDIQTAPPSRSRVKNSYPLIGMLSRGNCATFAETPPCLSLRSDRGYTAKATPKARPALDEIARSWVSLRRINRYQA